MCRLSDNVVAGARSTSTSYPSCAVSQTLVLPCNELTIAPSDVLVSRAVYRDATGPHFRRLQFADKNALGQSAILGLMYVWLHIYRSQSNLSGVRRHDAHINQNQFNLLGTIFYVFYLVASYPQNLALQRFPVAKWMR